ncbi:metallophosphoesterase [Olleya sp. YS]|uniref:metallophosphoesterase n=1 Tax=Olleya sp. YS TaxID=3028318 RepID=UPI0024341499|nr:metallophosphoesterase [Olleya sp. YS]WGD34199.1 metallophosphoesterase [Olleya sp. YS]
MKFRPVIIICFLWLINSSCKNNPQDNLVSNFTNTKNTTTNNVVIATDSSTSYFLSLSDVHLDSNRGYTKFGRHNDTGDSLWARTKTELEKVIKTQKPKFMVYLGDLPHHEDATRVKNVTLMLEHLRRLDIDIPLLYLPGNNDALGGDYNSFQDSEGKNPFSVNPNINDSWPVLHDTTGKAKISNMDFNKQFGFYSTDLTIDKDTLKIIALNTVIFTNSYYQSDDGVTQKEAAQKQFSWLENTLSNLNSSTPILMMMHIPPGVDNYSHSGLMWNNWDKIVNKKGDSLYFQNAFLDLVDQNSSQIKGMLTSHTHFDGIRRIYNSTKADDNALIGISISTPGITIGHGNNPGFKLFEYNNNTFDIIDFKTYFAKPTSHEGFKYFGDTYTFKNTYNVSDKKSTIYESITTMDSTEIKKYMSEIIAVKSYKTNKIVNGYHFYSVMNVLKDQ